MGGVVCSGVVVCVWMCVWMVGALVENLERFDIIFHGAVGIALVLTACSAVQLEVDSIKRSAQNLNPESL